MYRSLFYFYVITVCCLYLILILFNVTYNVISATCVLSFGAFLVLSILFLNRFLYFDHLLESSLRDSSNKWYCIRFGWYLRKFHHVVKSKKNMLFTLKWATKAYFWPLVLEIERTFLRFVTGISAEPVLPKHIWSRLTLMCPF